MSELNHSELPSEMATLLLLRGTGLAPLNWAEHPNRSARHALGPLSDPSLLGVAEIRDRGMASAVRALLFVWNGWTDDCAAAALGAHADERYYLSALCERHLGHPDASKALLQKLDGHPIYDELASFARQLIGATSEPALTRFTGILELNETWEPFAFIDLYEQARGEQLNLVDRETVAKIQVREFDLLLAYCYKAATGEEIGKRRGGRPVPVRKRPSPRRPRPAPSSSPSIDATRGPKKPSGPAPKRPAIGTRTVLPPDAVWVACPKCGTRLAFPAGARGKTAQCNHCSAMLMIPRKHAPAPA